MSVWATAHNVNYFCIQEIIYCVRTQKPQDLGMDVRRADLIADELEEMILTGSFEDGDRLDEIRLAEKFGVSRTPVREAFQRLVASGLAIQIPRRGVFVALPGPVELVEMFETMAEIEAVCARLAAMRISDTALDELSTINGCASRPSMQRMWTGIIWKTSGFTRRSMTKPTTVSSPAKHGACNIDSSHIGGFSCGCAGAWRNLWPNMKPSSKR